MVRRIQFNTDLRNNVKNRHPRPYGNNYTQNQIEQIAMNMNALLYVRTSNGTWYIKGNYSEQKYNECYSLLLRLQDIGQYSKSQTYLLRN